MPTNPYIKVSFGEIEKAIADILPKIASLPELSIEEDWAHYCDREKKHRISTNGNILEFRCDYEAISAIAWERFIKNEPIFSSWGVQEIRIFLGDRLDSKISID